MLVLVWSRNAELTPGDLSLDTEKLHKQSSEIKCVSYSERVKPTASIRRLTTMPQ